MGFQEYVGGMDRKIHKVNAASGAEVWLSNTEAQGGFYTNPVVVNDRVFAGNRDGAFYAIDVQTGYQVWKFQTGNQILQSPALRLAPTRRTDSPPAGCHPAPHGIGLLATRDIDQMT